MCLFAGLLLLIFMQPIANWIRTNREVSIGATIGLIAHVEGSVRRTHGADIELIPINLEMEAPLRDGDKIQTGYASKANLILFKNTNVEVPELSGVQLNRWDPADEKSPVYIRVIFGNLISKGTGESSANVFMIIKNKLFPSNSSRASEALNLVVKDTMLGANPEKFKREEENANYNASYSTSKIQDINPEALSLDYVNEVISNRREHFLACWHSYVRGASDQKNHMIVDFEISNTGAIESLNIRKNEIEDEGYLACVQKTLQTLGFRPFTGKMSKQTLAIEFI